MSGGKGLASTSGSIMADNEDTEDVQEQVVISTWGWEDYFQDLGQFIQSTEINYSPYVTSEYAEYVVDRLAIGLRNTTILAERTMQSVDFRDHNVTMESPAIFSITEALGQLIAVVSELKGKWESLLVELSQPDYVNANRYHVPKQANGKLAIEKEQIEYLRSLSFSWTDIAVLLGVSRMTLYRRRVEFGMLQETLESNISDSELLEIVQTIRVEMPDVGQCLVSGRLRSMDIHVSRERIRRCIQISDPLNTVRRWHGTTIRRPYSVPGPNSLWHIGMCVYMQHDCLTYVNLKLLYIMVLFSSNVSNQLFN